ncbi:MAG TPA: non-homologous end-joining DNA ligase, partial [Candidatus Nitrosocosmicus sp.]|nr:non-homologous end-joining DNA ligase [Candidatus Nitrosocosmicus sp.]
MLEEYNRKRNFKNTPEPSGNLLDEKNLKNDIEKDKDIPRFVIQKHDATRLHYDFRLESKKDKVLISWAVPKGPSLDPKVKRLAILTENHPVDYLLFEGIIPKGNYGAGTVIVWDVGTYCLESINPEKKEDVSDQFEKGKINFILFGQKLKGRFSLIRTSKENQWLLLKPQDNFSPSTNKEDSIQTDITKTNPESVISGLTNNQIKESNTSQEFLKEPKENSKSELQKPSSFPLLPMKRRSDEVNDNMYKRSIPGLSQSISDFYSQSKTNLSISSPNNSPVIRSPSFPSSSPTTLDDTNSNNILNNFKPMLATLIENPFNNQDWFFEIKWDGIRAISTLNNSKIIDIKSRNGNKITKRFPELVEALEALANINDLKNMMLDGEIVVLDKKGFPDFQALQKRININITKFIETSLNQFPATYYIFDILYLDGIDLKTLPLIERRKVLETIISKSKNNKKIKVSEFIGGEGKDIFHSIKKMNLEGMVAKHKQSKYYPNTRSREWLKIKNTRTQDCAVIGYTRGEGNRERYFGSLLLAAKVNSMEKINMDKLKFIGHCGSGFDFEQIIEIYEVLEKIKTKTCPIDYIPYVNREPIWVKPVL